MRRRDVLGIASVAAIWPLPVRAEPLGGTPRIGLLWPGSAEGEKRLGVPAAARARLTELGYVDGHTATMEERFCNGDTLRLKQMAAELVRLNVDLIMTGAEGNYAAASATKDIPIVTAAISDPVGLGLAASLAHPGGNVTGIAVFLPQIAAKRIEYLKLLAPSLSRLAVLALKGLVSNRAAFEAMSATAKALNLELEIVETTGAYPEDFAAMSRIGVNSVTLVETGKLMGDMDLIAALAAKYRLPLCGPPGCARAGGVFGYGVNFSALARDAANIADKILKGAKAGDLPIERASRFETVANLKAAAALGLEFPQSLLAAADEVIE